MAGFKTNRYPPELSTFATGRGREVKMRLGDSKKVKIEFQKLPLPIASPIVEQLLFELLIILSFINLRLRNNNWETPDVYFYTLRNAGRIRELISSHILRHYKITNI